MIRYTSSYGYKSRSEAEEILESMMAEAWTSPAHKPEVDRYKTESGKTRWRITEELDG